MIQMTLGTMTPDLRTAASLPQLRPRSQGADLAVPRESAGTLSRLGLSASGPPPFTASAVFPGCGVPGIEEGEEMASMRLVSRQMITPGAG
jgi:hypothetical protein